MRTKYTEYAKDLLYDATIGMIDGNVYFIIETWHRLTRKEYKEIMDIIRIKYDMICKSKIKKDKNDDGPLHTYYIFPYFNSEEDKNRFIMENL